MLLNEEKINVIRKKKRLSIGQPLFYIGVIICFNIYI